MEIVVNEMFRSPEDFFRTVESREVNKIFTIRASRIPGTKFADTESYEQNKDLMLMGDREALDKLNKAKINMSRKGFAQKRVLKSGPVGFAPVVPNYVIGVPNNMLSFRNENKGRKVVDVYINTSVSRFTTSLQVMESGIEIMQAVNALELNNYRVNVFIGICFSDKPTSEKLYQFAIKVKDSAAPLNWAKIAYFFVRSSFLRRAGFAWIESVSAEFPKGFENSYGFVKDFCAKTGITLNIQNLINSNLKASEIVREIEKQIK